MADSRSAKWTEWKEWFCYTQIDTRIGLPLECPLYEVDCKVVAKFNVRLEKLAGNHQDY